MTDTQVTDADVDVEILPLEGIDLENTPPCEGRYIWFWEFRKRAQFRRGEDWGELARACGKPSTSRMRVNCRACGARYSLFLCKLHALGFLRGKKVMCRVCRALGFCHSREI